MSMGLLLLPPAVRAQEASTETREGAKAKAEQKDGQALPQLDPQRAEEEKMKAAQKEEVHQRAEEQLKQQEHQRVLGIIPAFNSSNTQNAAPLTPSQKFRLAFKSATDPFAFAAAAVDAGINQAQDDYHGYGQGMAGYSKRFGASYGDTFNGTILGNALLPVLFHQDPRYFRKGTGSVKGRLWYAALSTVRCKSDSGHWQPSYSNLLGNMAAGTISNLYYPDGDRGIELTVKRAFTVSAEGAIGAMFFEFWPDISRKFARKHKPSN
jgi:hypothetical protein